MNKVKLFGLIGLSIFISSLTAWAGDFDGSRPLLLSVIRAIECTPDGECREMSPERIDLKRFLKIDFEKMTIRPARAAEDVPGRVRSARHGHGRDASRRIGGDD